jgi:diadenosine tetraphosphate (Ap4A) HIT family hydrolase
VSLPPPPTPVPACELCAGAGGTVLWRDAELRVVAVDDADYPGFVRVIWNEHVREWSDLRAASRARLLQALFLVEQAVRETLHPDKINLASLGNAVPHLHWHVIPRFADDAHFPQPIWGTRQRDCDPQVLARRRAAGAGLAQRIERALAQSAPAPGLSA